MIDFTNLFCNIPGKIIDEKKCSRESTYVCVTQQSSSKWNLETNCSELPEHIRVMVEDHFNEGNEIIENDWKRLFLSYF